MSTSASKIVVALDFSDRQQVTNFVQQINPEHCRLKVGKELFSSFGPELVRELVGLGFDVFLDLKYHDIPNTVAKACKAAADLGIWMVNVHATGGRKMMEAARAALQEVDKPPLLIAVTVLTSLSSADIAEVGLFGEPKENVMRLARLAKDSGLDGVVCSPQEVSVLREELGLGFALVTPGIRPAGSDKGDQKRIMTPAEAVRSGSDYLVIGRPITQADNPVSVLLTINSEIS